MFLLDLSGGVSPGLILSALSLLHMNSLSLLSEKIIPLSRNKDFPLFHDIVSSLKRENMNACMRHIKRISKKYSPVCFTDTYHKDTFYYVFFESLLRKTEVKSLDPLDFCIYIFTIILLKHSGRNFQVTVPGVGIQSRQEVFDLLRNEQLSLSTTYPVISVECALFLYDYLRPFVANVSNKRVKDVFKTADAVIPGIDSKVFAFEEEKVSGQKECIVVLETNIDDTTPELLAHAMHNILEAGALDYIVAPVTMKKGRSGFFIQILCSEEISGKIEELLLVSTSTFGVRKYAVERRILQRSIEKFDSSFGTVRVKKGYLNDKCIKIVPEFDDIIDLGNRNKISPINMYTIIMGEINRNFFSNEKANI